MGNHHYSLILLNIEIILFNWIILICPIFGIVRDLTGIFPTSTKVTHRQSVNLTSSDQNLVDSENVTFQFGTNRSGNGQNRSENGFLIRFGN